MPAPTATPRPVQERPTWRAVAVPAEHGGWGLTLEPVLLGLLLAWSRDGLALGAAAFVAFLARTPLKLALVDRRRGRALSRTRLAWWVVLGETAILLVLGALALAGAGWEWIVPVAVAAPLVVIELWFDVRSRSRRLAPELCGAIGISSATAAIVLAGGGEARLAIAAWTVLAARVVGSIPFVRTQILRLRHPEGPTTTSDVSQAAAIVAALGAVAVHPPIGAGAAAVMLLAAAQLWWVRRPVPPVKVLGLRQMALGLAVVAATATGVVVTG